MINKISTEGVVLYSSSFGLRDTTYIKITSIPPMKVININNIIQYDMVKNSSIVERRRLVMRIMIRACIGWFIFIIVITIYVEMILITQKLV